jgi:hypothetical protein
MDEKRTSLVPFAVALLLALPMLYVGSYYALVQVYGTRGQDFLGGIENPASLELVTTPFPRYRLMGDKGKTFFAPIHRLDRMIRPQTWAEQRTSIIIGPASLTMAMPAPLP